MALMPDEPQKIVLAPNFEIKKCHINFIATVSDRMRTALEFAPQEAKDKLSDMIRNVVVEIVDDFPQVAASIRRDNANGVRAMRQCDIRKDEGGEPGAIAFKTFLMWNRDIGDGIWHILVEMPDEHWVEDGMMTYEQN